MAHLTFLHFAKPVHAQSESPRVAVKASKERGERGDCISRPSLSLSTAFRVHHLGRVTAK